MEEKPISEQNKTVVKCAKLQNVIGFSFLESAIVRVPPTIDLLDEPFRRSRSSEPRPKAANIESWKMKVLDLADAYLTDPDSPFNSKVEPLRYVTQEGYKRLIARLVREMGDRELPALGARDLLHLHASWIDGDRIAM